MKLTADIASIVPRVVSRSQGSRPAGDDVTLS